MIRRCEACGTPLRGRRKHGFVSASGLLVCGRTRRQQTIIHKDGSKRLAFAETPRCAG